MFRYFGRSGQGIIGYRIYLGTRGPFYLQASAPGGFNKQSPAPQGAHDMAFGAVGSQIRGLYGLDDAKGHPLTPNGSLFRLAPGILPALSGSVSVRHARCVFARFVLYGFLSLRLFCNGLWFIPRKAPGNVARHSITLAFLRCIPPHSARTLGRVQKLETSILDATTPAM